MAIRKLSDEQGLQPELREKEIAAQAASTASDVAGVVVDLNLLIAKLKASGLMAD